MAEFQRLHPFTRDILKWSEVKAIDSHQPQIDTTHLMHACLINPDIRDWLRRIHVPVESSYLLMTLELPERKEESLNPATNLEEWRSSLMQAMLTPVHEVEGLTDRASKAIKVAGDEWSKFGSHYLYPIHIFSGVVQNDEVLIEHVLLGEIMTRERLMKEIEVEEERVRLSETLKDVERYMETGVDFQEKLDRAKKIEKFLNDN